MKNQAINKSLMQQNSEQKEKHFHFFEHLHDALENNIIRDIQQGIKIDSKEELT